MNEPYHKDDFSSLPGVFYIGHCFAIQVAPHPQACKGNGNHIVTIWVEDDENWFSETSFASYWLPELQELLNRVKE